jgi:micrococcal nuclease
MLLLSVLLIAAPAVAPVAQANDNPFTQSAQPKRTARRRTAAKRTTSSASSSSAGSTYYANCTAARAAGAAPVMRGQPGYSRKLDRDNDGVGCE